MHSPISSRSVAAVALLLLLGAPPAVQGQTLTAVPDRPDGVYAVGQTATWAVTLTGATQPVSTVRYVVKRGGLNPVAEGELALADGKASLSHVLDKPGWLLVELRATHGDATVVGAGGALFSPERIGLAQPVPDDFDAFWKRKLAELARVAPQPRLERADSGDPALDYYKVEMDHVNGSRIYGQLARLKGREKRPALLIVQWAGVYGLERDWTASRARAGWLVLNIMPHDLPFDRSAGFYANAAGGVIPNYPALGNDNRDTSYFLRMYLSCYRAAEYLIRRHDWDGKTLVVTGGSQGGMQTIVTAALHPRVTAGIAAVPAGCDLNGPVADRAPGWPMWHWATQGKSAEQVREAARYYDVANFARRVRCPILIGLGLVDTVCPPPGVYAMANQLSGPREVVVMPQAGHGGDHRAYHERSEAWFRALGSGEPAPVATPAAAR